MKWMMMSVAVMGMVFMVGCDNDDDVSVRSDRDTEWREARRDRDGAYAYTGDRVEQDRTRQDRMRQDGERRVAPMNGERWTVEGSSGEQAAAQPQGQQQQQQPRQQSQQNQAANQRDAAQRTIEITARDGSFNPNTIQARPNENLRVTLINSGTMEHNISFELPSGEKKLPNDVQPSARASMMVTAPGQAGEYTFYCPVGDHREKGMTGKLVVEGSQPVQPRQPQ